MSPPSHAVRQALKMTAPPELVYFDSMHLSRRQLLAATGAAGLAAGATRPKLAAVVTEIRKYSHGQHIVDRFLDGYGWNSEHHHPPMDLVSLYVDQKPSGDLTPD